MFCVWMCVCVYGSNEIYWKWNFVVSELYLLANLDMNSELKIHIYRLCIIWNTIENALWFSKRWFHLVFDKTFFRFLWIHTIPVWFTLLNVRSKIFRHFYFESFKNCHFFGLFHLISFSLIRTSLKMELMDCNCGYRFCILKSFYEFNIRFVLFILKM